jgi:hypothetical protein
MAEHLLHDVPLPDDMVWTDEFNWPTIIKSTEYTLTGSLIVDSGQRQAGRPITLAGAADGGWVTRATLGALRDLASALPGQYVLALADGRSFQVVFAPEEPLLAEPIFAVSDPGADWWYVATVKLIEV